MQLGELNELGEFFREASHGRYLPAYIGQDCAFAPKFVGKWGQSEVPE